MFDAQPGHDHAVGADAGEGEDVENADVQVRHPERDLVGQESEKVRRRTEGDHHNGAEGHDEHDDRRDAEDPFVGLGRDDVLFHDELDGIGDRLQYPVPAGPHRAQPPLHMRKHLALHKLQIHGVGQDEGQQHRDGNDEGIDDVEHLIQIRHVLLLHFDLNVSVWSRFHVTA